MQSLGDDRSARRSVPSKLLREAVLSTLLGVGVVFLIFLSRPETIGWRLAIYGGACGFFIFLSCRSLHQIVGEAIQRRSALQRPLAITFVNFVGGIVGWGLATFLCQVVGISQFHFSISDVGISVAVTGSLGIAFGLAFYSFGRLQDRLREGVARLKEAEFAEKELELARDIQRRLLPPAKLEGDGYRIAARNLAARFVAGDFYDVFHLADGGLGVAVADVSGKGMGAALIMASVKAVLPLLAEGRSARQTLIELNRKLAADLAPREFVALAYIRFDVRDGLLEMANAGLPDPYVLRHGQPPEPLAVPGPRLPLGARACVPYESLTMTLGVDERLLVITDGLPEAPVASGDPLGYENLASLFPDSEEDPAAWLDRMIAAVRTAVTPAMEDDWTALLLARRPL